MKLKLMAAALGAICIAGASAGGIREDGAMIQNVSDDQLAALALLIVKSGYRCDSVSAASRSSFDGNYRIHCNSYKYRYDIKDMGGNWTVFLK